MTQRLAVVGPSRDDQPALREAIETLLRDEATREIIYLGTDDAIDRVVDDLSREGVGLEQFLARGAELACSGDAAAIEALLVADRATQQLQRVHKLPEPPARAIEMLERWIILGVHDKAVLDEDDIANAHVVLYGKASQPSLKRFGPRCFFTPGPVSARRIGILDLQADGELEVQVRDFEGKVWLRERLHAGPGKVVVTA